MLQGQHVLITGGGSGLGAALAKRFVEEGARVAVVDISLERCESVADEIGREHVLPLEADVTDTHSLHKAVDAAVAEFGSLDTVIANAGIWDYNRSITRLNGEEMSAIFDDVMNVNLKGYLLTAEATWRHLLTSNGSLIFTLSNASTYAAGGGPVYTASKHGAEGMMLELAYELAPKIRVNGVGVGGMRTNLSGPASAGLDDRKFSDIMDKRGDGGNPYLPLHDISTDPYAFTGPYVLLASRKDGANITGEVIKIDGGIAARGFAKTAGGDNLC